MLNNFIYAQTKNLFLEALNAGNILDEAIVFIEDTKEIWNHGHYFGGDSGIDPEVLSGIETAIATLQSDKADKSELANYAKKNELPSLDGYLTKTVADGLYATIAQYNALNQTVGNIQTELSNKLTSADLEGYAKTADVPTKISDLEDDSDFITNAEVTAAYAPKSLVETVSDQATTISTLATKDALSTGLAGKLDNSAASGFVPTTRKVNGVALDQDITITATDPNAATKTELNNLSTNLTSEINKKATSATTLAGYGITDGVNTVNDVQTGTYITDITIEGHTLKTTRGSHTVTGKEVTDALGYTPLQGADITNLASKTDVSNAVTPISNRVTAIEGLIATDSDAVIDKWDEVVTFLDGIGADNDLEALLAAKANSSTVNDLDTRVTNLTTNNIAEGNNLYFTNARAVSALSNTLASYVPTSRTINGKKLTDNVTLSASDVGAASTGALNTTNTNLANLTSTVNGNSVSKSGETLTVTINGATQSLTNTNTWRSISDKTNGTSSDISASEKAVASAYSLANTANTAAVNAQSTANSKWTYSESTIKGVKVNNAVNADTVGGKSASNFANFYLSPMTSDAPADSAKSWFKDTMPAASGAIVYNVPGSEKTIIAGKSSGAYGHMLQLNYDDNYLRMLRCYNGTWKTTDWEKISAGYADSAGSATDQTARDAAAAAQTTANGKWTYNASTIAGVKVNNAGNADTVGGFTVGCNVPANAKFTDNDTHYTTGINAGATGATSNSAQINPYVTVKDNSTHRGQIRLVGSGATTVKSDANGNITISSTDTNTHPDLSSYAKKTDIPSIPSLSGGSAAETGKYVSGVTVSGHTVTVTKGTLPTIPSVGNGTVTVTQNGTTVGSFTMNQSGNTTIALTDTNTHPDLSSYATQTWVNNQGFTKNAGTVTGVKINGATKSPSSGIVDLGTVITSHQSLAGKQDVISDLATIRSNASNGATAYGWGNHANARYYKKPSSGIPNTDLANNRITISGKTVSLGGSLSQSDLRSALGLGSLAYLNSADAAQSLKAANGTTYASISSYPGLLANRGLFIPNNFGIHILHPDSSDFSITTSSYDTTISGECITINANEFYINAESLCEISGDVIFDNVVSFNNDVIGSIYLVGGGVYAEDTVVGENGVYSGGDSEANKVMTYLNWFLSQTEDVQNKIMERESNSLSNSILESCCAKPSIVSHIDQESSWSSAWTNDVLCFQTLQYLPLNTGIYITGQGIEYIDRWWSEIELAADNLGYDISYTDVNSDTVRMFIRKI